MKLFRAKKEFITEDGNKVLKGAVFCAKSVYDAPSPMLLNRYSSETTDDYWEEFDSPTFTRKVEVGELE